MPDYAHVFARLSAWPMTRRGRVLLEVVDEDVAIGEADTDHVGVLAVEVEAGHGGGGPALILRPGRVLEGEHTHDPPHKHVLEVI